MTETQDPYLTQHPASGHFAYAVKKLLSVEGGYVDDDDDPGGKTNFGISAGQFPGEDIENLTEGRAIALYREHYWEPNRYGEIKNRDIAAEMLDLCVLTGPRTANSLMQRALNRIDFGSALTVDGVCGRKTLAEINWYRSGYYLSDYLLCTLKLLECAHFVASGNTKFLRGWIRRAIL